MKFFKRSAFPALAVLLLVTSFFSCEEELTTIGDGVIGEEPFVTNRAEFDVFAFNKKIDAVRTNGLLLYQLGFFDDPVYGRTEAQVTSQLSLQATNTGVSPIFGSVSQSTEDANGFQENERVKEVFLYIPYITNSSDSDRDGVDNRFDADPLDPNSDTDQDNLTDIQEASGGTDPLNPDTDGDGLNDDVDDFTFGQRFPVRFAIDSVIGNRDAQFRVNVGRSTFFLRDFDPDAGFQENQEFFSNQQFAPDFVDRSLLLNENDVYTFSDLQIQFVVEEDDPDTEEDEEGMISRTLPPGIRIPLDPAFFQENLLDMEGSPELLSVGNFNNFLRGIHISIDPVDPNAQDILFLVNLAQANIEITYDHDVNNQNGTPDDTSDDIIEQNERMYTLGLLTQTPPQTGAIIGNAVNTFINEDYPSEITDRLDTGENASRIYLKGGAGSYAEIKLFDEENGSEVIEQIRSNNWIINEANLVFYVDRETLDVANMGNPMATSIEPLRLYLYNAETNEVLYNAVIDPVSSDSSLASFPQYDGVLETSDDDRGLRYTIRITNYINDILIRNEPNATLGLTVTSDIRIPAVANAMLSNGEEMDLPILATVNPFGTVLVGSNVPENDDRRLKLEIFYTQAN